MEYIVIDMFDQPTVVTDGQGEANIFEKGLEAEAEAKRCQEGFVVPLAPNLMETILKAYELIDFLEADEELKEKLGKLLGA